MYEYECEGKNNINKLSLTTDDFDKFSNVMTLIEKLIPEEDDDKLNFNHDDYKNIMSATSSNNSNTEESEQECINFMITNKVNFNQLIKCFNFWSDLPLYKRGKMIKAYENGKFDRYGWY